MLARLVEHIPPRLLYAAVRARRGSPLFARWTDWLAAELRRSDVTMRTGAAAGLRFATGRSNTGLFGYFVTGTREPDTEQALVEVLRPGMTFYDIGANFGLHSLIGARIVGPDGLVVSFEPLPENHSLLERNVGLNKFGNVRCLPVALGAEDGEARFLISTNMFCGMLAAGQRRPDGCAGEVTAEVRRLDSLIADAVIPPPQVMKMDIEGGEAAALAGADNLLKVWRPIMVIELHETAEAVASVLSRHGYESSLFGSRIPVGRAKGNVHAVAIPSEREDCGELLKRFRDPGFPRCNRCRSIPGV